MVPLTFDSTRAYQIAPFPLIFGKTALVLVVVPVSYRSLDPGELPTMRRLELACGDGVQRNGVVRHVVS